MFGISNRPTAKAPQVWSLHHGRSRKAIVRVVPDADSPLYRIAWPDIGLSPPANLTRCKDAARQWAERKVLTEDRKNAAGRRLKSLDNFSWSTAPIRFPEPPVALQFGVPLDVLRKALLRDPHGRPSTPIGCALDLLANTTTTVSGDEVGKRDSR